MDRTPKRKDEKTKINTKMTYHLGVRSFRQFIVKLQNP